MSFSFIYNTAQSHFIKQLSLSNRRHLYYPVNIWYVLSDVFYDLSCLKIKEQKNEDVSYVYIFILIPICSLKYLNVDQQWQGLLS